jgi:hypothetical protein
MVEMVLLRIGLAGVDGVVERIFEQPDSITRHMKNIATKIRFIRHPRFSALKIFSNYLYGKIRKTLQRFEK